jgi:hypothetical protein
MPPARCFVEDFSESQAGFYGWRGNQEGAKALEYLPDEDGGAVLSRSPWWIDYNHAPAPSGQGAGAGYLHMVYTYHLAGAPAESYAEFGGGAGGAEHTNAFIHGGHPTDWRNAQLTVRLRGEVERTNGASLCLLIQSVVDGISSGYILTSQPIPITPEYSETTITCFDDETKWTPLGSRHDRTTTYGVKPFQDVISDINTNILLIFFPLDVQPVAALWPPHLGGGPATSHGLHLPVGGRDPIRERNRGQYTDEECSLPGGAHYLRPERDYPVWRNRLPDGYVLLSRFEVAFSAAAAAKARL